MKQLRTVQGGFTLIEIILVLAIASLLIMSAIMAYAGFNRAQEDNRRKAVTSAINADLQKWSSNNYGSAPLTAADQSNFTANYPLSRYGSGISFAGTGWYSFTQDGSGAQSGTGGVMPALQTDEVAIIVPGSRKAFSCIGLDDNQTYCSDSASQVVTYGSIVSNQLGGSAGGSVISNLVGSMAGASYTGCSDTRCRTSGTVAYTNWAPVRFDYTSSVPSGEYTLWLSYKNNGAPGPPADYSNYSVNVYVNGVLTLANQQLPVVDGAQAPAAFTVPINIGSDNPTIGIEWTNDRNVPPNDANISIMNIGFLPN